MIGSVHVRTAGYLALTGLGCGLAATLLKGRTIANWTWMASTMTFQQGAMIGCGLVVVNVCCNLFLSVIDKISWLSRPQKFLAALCIILTPRVSFAVALISRGLPVLSYLTFFAISESFSIHKVFLVFPDWRINSTYNPSARLRFEPCRGSACDGK